MGASSFASWLLDRFGVSADGEEPKLGVHCQQLLRTAGVDSPPTSLNAVAALLGLDAKPTFRPQAEMGLLDPKEARIYLRRAPNEVITTGTARYLQLRFTYAHELGHALLYDFRTRPAVRLAPFPADSSEEEEFCNRVAAHLLMPEFLLARTFPSPQILSGDSLYKAANSYKVSLLAMTVRMAQLFGDLLGPKEFYLLSGEISNRKSSGLTKPRCVACFLPPELRSKRIRFLATHQGVEHIHLAGNPDEPWSLLRLFAKSPADRPLHSATEVELLKCQSRHIVELTSRHHRITGCRYIWTEGTIELPLA